MKVLLEKRFWNKINMMGPKAEHMNSRCWVWTGATRAYRYGALMVEGKGVAVTRMIYQEALGGIPNNLHVLHKCDNPLCVRPSHLFLGTHLDNMKDRNSKGRARGGKLSGEQHPLAKLSQSQIEMIKTTYANGKASQYALAEQFNISQAHVSNIVSGNRRRTG